MINLTRIMPLRFWSAAASGIPCDAALSDAVPLQKRCRASLVTALQILHAPHFPHSTQGTKAFAPLRLCGRKTRIRVSVTLVLPLLIGALPRFVQPASAAANDVSAAAITDESVNKTNAAPETASAAPDAPAPAAVDPIVAILTQGGDPFQFRYRTGGGGGPADPDGMIPVDTRSVSSDIRVRGLLRLADKTPAALLQIRSGESPVLVRKGDLLFVPQPVAADGRRPNRAVAAEPLYLLIDEIRDDCVLVAPKKNPDAIMMLR